MRHTLVHIYGPFTIHSFGFMIAAGLLLFTWLVGRHPLRKKLISYDALINILLVGVVAALIGGRLLYLASEWDSIRQWSDIITVWQGGLSGLGCVVGVLAILPLYLKRHAIPIIPLLDLFALYVPLLQACSRIGCFLAGCCYGTTTNLPWAIVYTDQYSDAPLGVLLHPVQLYSSLAQLGIFLILYYLIKPYAAKQGQMLASFLILVGIERFSIDFLRGDQQFFTMQSLSLFSLNQWVALAIIIGGCTLLIRTTYYSLNKTLHAVKIP